MVKYKKFKCDKVKEIFDHYPENIKSKTLFLREFIFKVAARTHEVGEIEELIRWGEPSYATSITKSGSTIRIGWKKITPNHYYLYFNCKTTLVDTFKEMYGDIFTYGGNRSLIFHEDVPLPLHELSDCIAMALTYKLSKKRK